MPSSVPSMMTTRITSQLGLPRARIVPDSPARSSTPTLIAPTTASITISEDDQPQHAELAVVERHRLQ